MKRFMSVFVIALLSIALLACGKKEFANDGTFLAFEESVHDGAAMLTWVEVVVEDGKIKSFNIDALQGKIEDGKHVWNEKSKKELAYDYRMHDPARSMSEEDYKAWLKDNNKLEWFEQANLIEEQFLANGVGSIDGITGVTIVDGGYSRLAAKAVENAKAGIYTAFEESVHDGAAMLTWVEITVNSKGKIESYNIDALQGKIEDGKHVWNEKSKKELAYDYRMHDPARSMSEADYKTWLKENNKLEWFEQANLIEAHFLANKAGSIDGITGVTIVDGGYSSIAKAAEKFIK